jgi:hypothetical protein
MNTKSVLPPLFLFLIVTACAAASRGEFDFTTARPTKKDAVAVNLTRNPFVTAADTEKPLPVLQDKDDPATKVPAIIGQHLRSVLRSGRSLVLLDENVFQAGDEIKLGHQPVIAKYRVFLKSIESDRLVLTVVSSDPQQPSQVDTSITLIGAMRKK